MNQSQCGFAVWLTGLPSSGKTTLAHALERLFNDHGVHVQVLDSDELREIITPTPQYTSEERDWFYKVIVFLAELLTKNGVNVIIAATAPKRAYREDARRRIKRFVEVYLQCSPQVCRQRDRKGLWKRSDNGDITTLPGAGFAYEPPCSPELQVDTDTLDVLSAVERVCELLREKGFVPRVFLE